MTRIPTPVGSILPVLAQAPGLAPTGSLPKETRPAVFPNATGRFDSPLPLNLVSAFRRDMQGIGKPQRRLIRYLRRDVAVPPFKDVTQAIDDLTARLKKASARLAEIEKEPPSDALPDVLKGSRSELEEASKIVQTAREDLLIFSPSEAADIPYGLLDRVYQAILPLKRLARELNTAPVLGIVGIMDKIQTQLNKNQSLLTNSAIHHPAVQRLITEVKKTILEIQDRYRSTSKDPSFRVKPSDNPDMKKQYGWCLPETYEPVLERLGVILASQAKSLIS